MCSIRVRTVKAWRGSSAARVRASRCDAVLVDEPSVAALEVVHVPGAGQQQRLLGPARDATEEHGGVLLDVERVQQRADLLLAVARRDPRRVLHRAEPEEAQALGELRALDATVLRDRVPDDGPRVGGRGAAAEREDPAVALGEQLVRARAQRVEDEPALALALEQPAGDQPRERRAGGLGREPELAEDLDHAARPHALPRASQVRAEDRDREVLRLEGGVSALGLCLRAGAQGLTLHVISVPCSISLSGPVIHCPPFAMHKSR